LLKENERREDEKVVAASGCVARGTMSQAAFEWVEEQDGTVFVA
jgi:hypothetical protein